MNNVLQAIRGFGVYDETSNSGDNEDYRTTSQTPFYDGGEAS